MEVFRFSATSKRELLDFFFGKQREERHLCTVNICHQLFFYVKKKNVDYNNVMNHLAELTNCVIFAAKKRLNNII